LLLKVLPVYAKIYLSWFSRRTAIFFMKKLIVALTPGTESVRQLSATLWELLWLRGRGLSIQKSCCVRGKLKKYRRQRNLKLFMHWATSAKQEQAKSGLKRSVKSTPGYDVVITIFANYFGQ
jgi:hypothetical protein